MTEAEVKANMQVLIETPAWMFFKDYIRKNDIKLHKDNLEMAERNPEASIAEIRDLRMRIDMLEDLLEIPEATLRRLASVEPPRNKDPYCQNEQEIKELGGK